VYSLKRHYDKSSTRKTKAKRRSTSRKGDPLGTIEPIKEETADSNLRETLQSVNKQV
jgi:hypothetical protein